MCCRAKLEEKKKKEEEKEAERKRKEEEKQKLEEEKVMLVHKKQNRLEKNVKRSDIRDWSLITGRGGLQNGKIAGPKLFAPPPQDRVKLFAPPLLKSGNFSCPPYNMAKTSSYRVKSTPKLFVPPLQHG